MKRGGRLNPMSAKRRRQLPTRAKVRAFVIERDQVCQFWTVAWGERWPVHPEEGDLEGSPLGCWGGWEVHEIVNRSAWKDAWVTPDYCILLCSRHHHHVTGNPLMAGRLGLHLPGSAVPKELRRW